MKRRRRVREAVLGRGGRAVALVALALLLLIRAFDPAPVASARVKLFDLYQRLAPAGGGAAAVLIVDIDDASLARYGQWPWPRNLMARLVEALAAADAAVLGMDVLFAEPDRMGAQGLADMLPAADAATRQALAALPDGDRALAESFRALPVVLGTAIDIRPAASDGPVPAGPPLIERGADPRPFLPRFDRLVPNIPVLAATGAGTGLVSLPIEPDGVVRRVPAAIGVGQAVVPSLAVEVMRVAGNGGLTVATGPNGIEAIALPGGAPIATDAQGRLWIHYGRGDPARYISAAGLLDGTTPADRLRGRLVLLGATAAGLLDLYPTPLGMPMPGVEIHAQLLENLRTGDVLERPALATLAELAAALALGLALILLQRRLRARWLFLTWVAGAAALILGTWAMYVTERLLLDGVYPAFVAGVATILVVAGGFIADRRDAEAKLRERERRLRALQAELLDVSRRSAMAQLSSALAHELNQPLSAIGNYVQACRRMLISAEGQASDKIYGFMDRAVEQVERAAAIITGLRDIVETGHTARAPEEANPVLEEAVATALLGPGTAGVTVSQRYAARLPPVLINRIQIQQVVLNLVRNAVEAMAGTPRRALAIESLPAEDGGVEVRIRDTGPGLAPEVEARLFRPVVSSKSAGMGIGLSISRSIIEAHGGRLWATRNDGPGMTFHFTLPAVTESDE
jgi:CHASE2 domain-containing sensor protein/nitrogen-specific signal transduction histidine kinase